jgi:formylglycine-generating enzyme required for sulfatase activity/serine/threonine protein kinase
VLSDEALKQVLSDPQLAGLHSISAVGSGGYGFVFKARLGDAWGALKIQDLEDERRQRRFAREVEAMRRLNHPGIANLRAAGLRGSFGWILMDWCEGPTLRERIEGAQGEPLPEDWLSERFYELAQALSAAHELGILHRDIKPGNILIVDPKSPRERAVLVDFGMARSDSGEFSKSLTRTGDSIGTLAFMSPEQLEAKGEFGAMSAASDVWGLGATLYFALTGREPFARPTALEVYAAIALAQPEHPCELRGAASPWLAELALRCLRLKPGDRIGLDELSDALAAGRPADSIVSEMRPRRSRRLAPALIFLILLISLGLALPLRSRPLRLIEGPVLPAATSLNEIELRARVNQPQAELRLGGESLRADSEGLVQTRLAIREGVNRWTLESSRGPLLSFEVIGDRKPPRFLNLGESARPWPEQGTLRGALEAEEGLSLFFEDRSLKIERDGRFFVELAPKARTQRVELRAIDRAGNECRTVLPVESPLADIEVWRRIGEAAQDAVIEDLTRVLGEDFEYQRTQVFSYFGRSLRTASFRHQSSGIELNLLPGGRFIQGSELNELGRWETESPTHEARVPPLLVGLHEVTQEQWDRISGRDQRRFRGARLPIESVSWNEASDWTRRLGSGLRLPSESEWEYACRAGSPFAFSFGADTTQLADFAWFDQNSEKSSHEVAGKKPNAFGLYDMHGNVWEWCLDSFHGSYEGAPGDGAAWLEGGDPERRMNRGGGWSSAWRNLRSAIRSRDELDYRDPALGLRVFRSLDN